MFAFVINKTLRLPTVRRCKLSVYKHLAFAVTAVSIRGMRIVKMLSYSSPISQDVSIAVVTTNTRLSKSLVDRIRDDAVFVLLLISGILVVRHILHIG